MCLDLEPFPEKFCSCFRMEVLLGWLLTLLGDSVSKASCYTQTDYLIHFFSSPLAPFPFSLPPSPPSLPPSPPSLPLLPLLSSPLFSSLLSSPFSPPSFFSSPLFPPFLFVGLSTIIALFSQSLLYFPVFATIDTTIPILGYVIGFFYSSAL